MKADAMKVNAGDRAALCFRARDALNSACLFLDGRSLDEGQTVRVVLTTQVVRNPAGALVFGPMQGNADYV